MFCGTASPVTQSFGLGVFDPVGPAEFDRIEGFFRDRGAHVHLEISPLADKSIWPQIADRGYVPLEFTSVMFQELNTVEVPQPPETISVRVALADDREAYIRTAIAGWSHLEGMGDFFTDMMGTAFESRTVVPFVAEQEGQLVATGALNIHGGVAVLAGASTIPEARRQGAQRALLAARLRYAREAGCDIAVIGAEPGSGSQRNAERQGFRIAYTRTKWELRKTPV